MSIRTLLLTAAIGFAGFGTASAAPAATPNNGGGGGGGSGGNFVCANGALNIANCIGSIAVLPVNVNIQDVLSNDQISALDGALDNLAILDLNVLDDVTILTDVKDVIVSVLGIDGNKVNVCTTVVLGVPLCL